MLSRANNNEVEVIMCKLPGNTVRGFTLEGVDTGISSFDIVLRGLTLLQAMTDLTGEGANKW